MYALDPVTGRQLWHSTVGFNASSPTNRGVAYGDGSVFLATANAWLIALNAATGKQVWSRQILPGTANSAIGETMAPLFDRGRVIAGVTLGERAGPGFVAAYDGRTGRQDWRFQTIPGPGDPARRTWPKGFDPRGAGGAVWMTPAVDPALNLIYVTVGNPVPDYLGQDRAGANLYTASIVALHADSGRLAWYFQEVHHDLWDYDPASPAVLLTLKHGKERVPALIQAGKTGRLYVLDRRDGHPLVATPERKAPAGPAWQHAYPTQPMPQNQPFSPQCPPKGLYEREGCIFTPPGLQPTLIAPGGDGGASWAPVAYSERTGLAYICANALPYLESGIASFGDAYSILPSVRLSGQLVGYDVARGTIAWHAPMTTVCFGGSAVTATDIVFTGESSGLFDARDARTGRLLWQANTFGGADAAPAIYAAGGHEYIAVNAGGNAIVDRPRTGALDVYALR